LNLHIFFTPCTHESRLLKECRAIHSSFDKVLVAAVGEEELPEHETIAGTCEIWRISLATRKWPRNLAVQTLKYLEWMIRIFWGTKKNKVEILHCHSLPALPVGVLLKLFLRAKLVYDAHELETETDAETGLRKRLSQWAESFFIRFADHVLVVSDSIADWYQKHYGIERPQVIRNIPEGRLDPATAGVPLKEKLKVPREDVLFLYLGVLSPGRGIERILRVFAKTGKNRHVVFMGHGSLAEKVREEAGIHPNIHYLPPVPPRDVLSYAVGADVGLCLIENTCLSYYFSLPNKLFEYILAGVPVLINDFPEQRKIVEAYECGWVAPEADDQLASLIDSLSSIEIGGKKAGTAIALEHLDWRNERAKVQSTYEQLLKQ